MKNKKRFGDRKDGVLLRNVDSMHFIMPIIYPNRCDNEAFITETMDLTNLDAFLEKKNADNPEYKYNLFQCLVTAALKTISLRSKMNRFIANGNMYQRNEVSAAFTVKQVFTDDGDEVLAFIHSRPEFTLKDIHDEIGRQLKRLRQKDAVDPSTDIMNIFNKIPRVISKTAVKFVCFLDKHGWVPSSFIETDPYYSSVVLSNLGSLHLQSGPTKDTGCFAAAVRKPHQHFIANTRNNGEHGEMEEKAQEKIRDRNKDVQNKEKDNTYAEDNKKESCAAAWMKPGECLRVFGSERKPGFMTVDGFMLSAMILESSSDIRNVAAEDHITDKDGYFYKASDKSVANGSHA